MIDYHTSLVSSLKKVLPTYHEMILTEDSETPCISYMESNNYVAESGDTLEYSNLSYIIKVWANDIKTIQEYALKIDLVLRPLGWKRVSSGELYDKNSSMIQKIMTYQALGYEKL